ncbi:MAG: hypothetical protein WCT27_03340 [Patescibacteria group bacterium]|jgi:hypothetical protein
MPVPVFEQLSADAAQIKPDVLAAKNPRYTSGAIFFAILMVVALVVLGEFVFRDSSRLFNPYYQDCQSKTGNSSILSGKSIKIPASCQVEKYERSRLILHADFVVPIALVMLMVFAVTRRRLESAQLKLILLSLYIFTGWIIVRVLGETEYYLLKHHELIGRYTVILTVVGLLAIMIIIVQYRANKKVS